MNIPLDKDGWPKWVPVLTAEHICHGAYDGPDGTHCIAGWSRHVFGCSPARHTAEIAILDVVRKSLARFNDSSPYAEVAATWNRVMASLGYTEGNPEAAS